MLQSEIKEKQIFLEAVFDAIVNETKWLVKWISKSNQGSDLKGGINTA